MLLAILFSILNLNLWANDIIVTANKLERNYTESSSTIKVFNRDDIEAIQAQTILDLIRRTPGMQAYTNGAFGKTSTLYTRGSNNGHTLVLVDGVEINDPSSVSGGARLEFIKLDQIEKVEILKGSQGVLYGSKAIGGVIKITSRKNSQKEDQKKVFLYGGLGSFSNKRISIQTLGATGEERKIQYSLGVNWQDVEGISSFNENKAVMADKDSYTQTDLNGNISYQMNDKRVVSFSVKTLNSDYKYDDYSSDNTNDHGVYKQNSYQFKLNEAISKSYSLILKGNYLKTKRYSFSPNNGASSGRYYPYEASQYKISLQNNLKYGMKNSLVAGVEYEKEEASVIENIINGKVNKNKKIIFLSHYFKHGFFFFDQGVRLEKIRFSGNEMTYKLGAGFFVPAIGMTFKSSFSTGLRTPNLYNTYSQYGNENLRSEKSKTYEFGALFKSKKFFIETTLFKLNYDRLIGSDNNFKFINTGDYTLKGIEFSQNYLFDLGLKIYSAYSFIQTKNEETGKYLLKRPKMKLDIGADYLFEDFAELGIDYSYTGERNDFGGIRLPSYTLLGCRMRYFFSESMNIGLNIKNILNKKYEEAFNYGTPGRHIMLNFRAKL